MNVAAPDARTATSASPLRPPGGRSPHRFLPRHGRRRAVRPRLRRTRSGRTAPASTAPHATRAQASGAVAGRRRAGGGRGSGGGRACAWDSTHGRAHVLGGGALRGKRGARGHRADRGSRVRWRRRPRPYSLRRGIARLVGGTGPRAARLAGSRGDGTVARARGTLRGDPHLGTHAAAASTGLECLSGRVHGAPHTSSPRSLARRGSDCRRTSPRVLVRIGKREARRCTRDHEHVGVESGRRLSGHVRHGVAPSPDRPIQARPDERPGERRGDVDPEIGPLRRTSAGPNERAGFMDAPVTGPPNSASSATVPPIAIAAAAPTAGCRWRPP